MVIINITIFIIRLKINTFLNLHDMGIYTLIRFDEEMLLLISEIIIMNLLEVPCGTPLNTLLS